MANVKDIYITGWVPFDGGRNDDFLAMLGSLSLPAMGTTIKWGREEAVPNQYGGHTAMFEFELSGMEALSWHFLDRFKELVHKIGRVTNDETIDIEA